MPKGSKQPEDYIVPLNMNGLQGRMLRIPAKKKNAPELLFIYGSHSSLERWWGVALELNKVGAVTMPDLPGMGGMTPLYKIGRQPDIDTMADYLAAFIKLKYRNKKVTIVGMSLGFVIATRMLQNYPQMIKKVDKMVSVVGFVHKSDLSFSRSRLIFYKTVSRLFARKWPSKFFRAVFLRPSVIKAGYHKTRNAKEKFAQISGDEFRRTMDMEIELWHINDIRTQFKHYLEIFALDNTIKRINLPVLHVSAQKDRYFDNVLVEEHMRRVFNDFELYQTKAPNHAPTVIATAKQAAPFIPMDLRKRLLDKK